MTKHSMSHTSEYYAWSAMDSELFELCKSVYERTGWYDTDFHFRPAKNVEGVIVWLPQYRMGNYDSVHGSPVPLYTSDYLLEKLDFLLTPLHGHMTLRKLDDGYHIDADNIYEGPRLEIAISDTPLKALLLLTLNLIDQGIDLKEKYES